MDKTEANKRISALFDEIEVIAEEHNIVVVPPGDAYIPVAVAAADSGYQDSDGCFTDKEGAPVPEDIQEEVENMPSMARRRGSGWWADSTC